MQKIKREPNHDNVYNLFLDFLGVLKNYAEKIETNEDISFADCSVSLILFVSAFLDVYKIENKNLWLNNFTQSVKEAPSPILKKEVKK